MQVIFTRTAARRYRVRAEREMASRVEMEPAPGYDDYLPHDLVHFVVERRWALKNGVFGQLASGGDAATFRPIEELRTRRWARQSARRNFRNRSDVARSEALAAVAVVAWNKHAGRAHGPEHAGDALESAQVTEAELPALIEELDGVAREWHALEVGESLAMHWPWPERRG